MNKRTATALFESLSSGIRLGVYRLLMKAGPDGMVAGRISTALDIPPANLSFHLKAMTQSGLIKVEQEGRFQRYRADVPLMVKLVAYLTQECCAGHPELCAIQPLQRPSASRPAAVASKRKTRIGTEVPPSVRGDSR